MKKRLEEIKKSLLWWPILIVLAVIVLDQITKIWTLSASGNVPHGPALYVVIEDYFNFVDYRNTGAAWGMFSGNPPRPSSRANHRFPSERKSTPPRE